MNLEELYVLDPNPVMRGYTPVGEISVYQIEPEFLDFIPAEYEGAEYVAVSTEHERWTYGDTPEEALNQLRYILGDKKLYQ